MYSKYGCSGNSFDVSLSILSNLFTSNYFPNITRMRHIRNGEGVLSFKKICCKHLNNKICSNQELSKFMKLTFSERRFDKMRSLFLLLVLSVFLVEALAARRKYDFRKGREMSRFTAILPSFLFVLYHFLRNSAHIAL